MTIKNQKKYGFTLIEIIITISILSIIFSEVFIWFINYQRQIELDSTTKNIVMTLRDAQSRSISGENSKKWGVFFDDTNNKFILFQDIGSGYSTATIKEETYLPKFIKIDNASLAGGCNEIIFTNTNGNTTQNCTIKIVDTIDTNTFKNIFINSLGLIDIK